MHFLRVFVAKMPTLAYVNVSNRNKNGKLLLKKVSAY